MLGLFVLSVALIGGFVWRSQRSESALPSGGCLVVLGVLNRLGSPAGGPS